MIRTGTRWSLSIAGTALLAATPLAAEPRGERPTREYVEAAGQSDAFEIFEADAALAQSGDGQVRAFAQKMLEDHRQLGTALVQATGESNLTAPPTRPGADQAQLLGALQGLRGLDFDQTYWRHQVLAHRSALTSTQIYASNGPDAAVRLAAAAALATIAAHLSMAEKMDANKPGPQPGKPRTSRPTIVASLTAALRSRHPTKLK